MFSTGHNFLSHLSRPCVLWWGQGVGTSLLSPVFVLALPGLFFAWFQSDVCVAWRRVYREGGCLDNSLTNSSLSPFLLKFTFRAPVRDWSISMHIDGAASEILSLLLLFLYWETGKYISTLCAISSLKRWSYEVTNDLHYSFTQQIFMEHLLCARHWGHNVEWETCPSRVLSRRRLHFQLYIYIYISP